MRASTGTWSLTGSLMDAVTGAGFSVLSSSSSLTKVLRAGGKGIGGITLTGAEIYNSTSGTWTPTGSLHDPRSGFGITKLTNGDVLAAGGTSIGGVLLTTAEQYSQSLGIWSTQPSMNDARSRFRMVLLNNGDVLAAGGVGFAYLTSAERYSY